jgi:diguanylate cyclase (GGDEF)-like protein/PAS domain S-box-containing protein
MSIPPTPTRSGLDTAHPAAAALLDQLADMVFVVSPVGTLCYANPACAEFVGRPVNALIGTNILDLVHPDDRGLAVESLGETTAKGPGTRQPLALRVMGPEAEGGAPTTRTVELIANNRLDDPDLRGIVICARDVTASARADEQLAEVQRRFEMAFEHSPFGRSVISPDGRFVRVNPAMAALSGYPAEQLVGMHVAELAHPDEVDDEGRTGRRLLGGQLDYNTADRRLRHADGHEIWVQRTFWVTRGADGRAQQVDCEIVDLTERREADLRVLQLLDVLETSAELVIFTDAHGKIEYVNELGRDLLGLEDGDEPRGRLESYLAADAVERVVRELVPQIAERGLWSGELTLRTRLGEEIPVASTIQAHKADDGNIALVSAIAHDIRELKGIQQLLQHQATHDVLTMLPNRQLFQELGEQALARADREGTTVAVLFLDLDRFKHVNDSFGHPVGDELLVEVANRLRECVRRGDVVARFGGDEFVVCCEHPAGQVEMLDLAGRLIDAISQPAELRSATAHVGVSIGIAIGAGSRVTIDTLLRDADVALYQAKEQGRGRAVIFGTAVDPANGSA